MSGKLGAGNSTLFSRLKNHLSDHLADRWDKFSWFGVRKVNKSGFGVRKVNKSGKLSKTKGELNRTLKANEILDLLGGSSD